ncbi:MAG: hypothetical protein KDA65_12160 [Planctomycetaceae bacterium]|nr:hypothetical protein [Planctomycetaceae bacterium]
MLNTQEQMALEALYPYPAIRCRRITRMERSVIGDVQLDSETAAKLGSENIGVFVEGCSETRKLADQIETLVSNHWRGTWVIVTDEETADESFFNFKNDAYWRLGNGVLSTPEGLADLLETFDPLKPVTGILVIDPMCEVRKLRSDTRNRKPTIDAAEQIAEYRAALTDRSSAWAPPLFLFTQKPAKSVNTQLLLAPYGLDAWWFADGGFLRVGMPPDMMAEIPID